MVASRWLNRRHFFRQAFRLFLRARRFLRNSELSLVQISTVTAVGIGLVVAGLHFLVLRLNVWAFDLPAGSSLSSFPHDRSWRILVIPVLGGVVLGLTRWRFKLPAGKSIVDPIEANALHGGQMSLRDSARLVMSTLTSNIGGASVGMEAGYTQIGAAILSNVGRVLRIRREEMRIFVSAGAAAAISAAFDAPLAGAFYGFEVVHGRYTVRSLAPVALASLAGALTVRSLGLAALIGTPPPVPPVETWVYLAGVVLGVGAAYIAILTMWSTTLVERIFKSLQIEDWIRPTIGAVLLGVLATASTQVLGSGQGAIQYHFENHWPLAALLVLLFAKIFASSFSLGAGFRGGLFSCSLMLGCVYGGAFTGILSFFVPSVAGMDITFKLMGMAAVGAGIIGAPLTMSLLVLETTQNFNLTIAVIGGATVASMLVRLRFGYSFATWRFHARGLAISSPDDIGWLSDLKIERSMQRNPPLAFADEHLDALRTRFPSGSVEMIYVVDRQTQYCGFIDPALLESPDAIEANSAVIAIDIARGREQFLLMSDSVPEGLRKFELWHVEQLAILRSGSDRTLVGANEEAELLKYYAKELEKRSESQIGGGPAP